MQNDVHFFSSAFEKSRLLEKYSFFPSFKKTSNRAIDSEPSWNESRLNSLCLTSISVVYYFLIVIGDNIHTLAFRKSLFISYTPIPKCISGK